MILGYLLMRLRTVLGVNVRRDLYAWRAQIVLGTGLVARVSRSEMWSAGLHADVRLRSENLLNR